MTYRYAQCKRLTTPSPAVKQTRFRAGQTRAALHRLDRMVDRNVGACQCSDNEMILPCQ